MAALLERGGPPPLLGNSKDNPSPNLPQLGKAPYEDEKSSYDSRPRKKLDIVADQELTFLGRIGAIPNRARDRPNQGSVEFMLGVAARVLRTKIKPPSK